MHLINGVNVGENVADLIRRDKRRLSLLQRDLVAFNDNPQVTDIDTLHGDDLHGQGKPIRAQVNQSQSLTLATSFSRSALIFSSSGPSGTARVFFFVLSLSLPESFSSLGFLTYDKRVS